jgi:hypothetical protein
MKELISIALLLLCICCFGQSKQQKLLVAEYRVDSPRIARYTYLVSYNFKDGFYTSKDTLFSTITECISYSDKNYVYKNRYVISSLGAVLDTKTKTLLRETGDRFIEGIGDTLVFNRQNYITGRGYPSLNLTTSEYGFIKEKSWYRPNRDRESPDGQYYLTIDQSKTPYSIYLNDNNGQKVVLVQDAGNGPYTIDTQFPTVETHWLDNRSFLYAIHKPNRDAQGRLIYEVRLHRYNIEDHSNNVFYILDSVPKGPLNGRFFIDATGQTLYRTTYGSSYIIDTANKNLLENHYAQLGFGISTRHFKEGTVIYHANEEIGRIWCKRPEVTYGAIAVMYGDVGSNLGYPKGIKVWTQQTKSWMTFDIPWVSNIIGWMHSE